MRASLELQFSPKWTVESVGDEDDEDDRDYDDNNEDDVVSCVRQKGHFHCYSILRNIGQQIR